MRHFELHGLQFDLDCLFRLMSAEKIRYSDGMFTLDLNLSALYAEEDDELFLSQQL